MGEQMITLDRNALIAVTSRSFSRNQDLVNELRHWFPHYRLSDAGVPLEGEELISFLQGAHGVIAGTEKYDSATFHRLTELKVVSRFGVGTDSIDLVALDDAGVHLEVTSGLNASAVAELTLTLMLMTVRRVWHGARMVVDGGWAQVTAHQLRGKSIGLVGMGNVARELNSLLQSFNCTVMGHDTSDVCLPNVSKVSLKELLSQAHIVSLHVPLTVETRGLIGAAEIDMMKTGAILINTSRGGIVSEQSVLRALDSGKLGAVGLDVLETEPPSRHPLIGHPNAIVTPHMAGTSIESTLAMGKGAIANLLKYVPDNLATGNLA